MRIIAGKYKSRTIKFPKSKLVRPTTDRAKESIFNFLSNKIDFNGISVCDIYAGSGSLGLEALSRGAGSVVFVERDFHVSGILDENIKSIDEENRCRLYRMDAIRFSAMESSESFDLILADPPFFKDDIYKVTANILSGSMLAEEGLIIVERSVQTEKEDTEAFGIGPERKIGDSLIYIIKK